MGCDNWDLGLSGSQNPVTSALRLNLLSPLGDSWFKSLQNDSKIAPGMEIRLRVSIIGMSILGWLCISWFWWLLSWNLDVVVYFSKSYAHTHGSAGWPQSQGTWDTLFLCVLTERLRARGRELGNQWVWVRACGGPIWGVCSEAGGACWCGCGVCQDKSWLHFQIISPICFQAKYVLQWV